jgi:hypothetical protein
MCKELAALGPAVGRSGTTSWPSSSCWADCGASSVRSTHFFALASVLGLILVFYGSFEIIQGVASRPVNPVLSLSDDGLGPWSSGKSLANVAGRGSRVSQRDEVLAAVRDGRKEVQQSRLKQTAAGLALP